MASLSTKRNMEEEQFELLQVCAGHLSASETPTPSEIRPQGFLKAGHTGKFGFQRVSDGNKPQG